MAVCPNHELRVVILSNLASVNKLLGHLKESLDNIKDAEALFLPQEILSDYEIADKLIKYWCTKLFMIKAEVLELLEVQRGFGTVPCFNKTVELQR